MNIDKLCTFVFNGLVAYCQSCGGIIVAITALCIVWSCAVIVREVITYHV